MMPPHPQGNGWPSAESVLSSNRIVALDSEALFLCSTPNVLEDKTEHFCLADSSLSLEDSTFPHFFPSE